MGGPVFVGVNVVSPRQADEIGRHLPLQLGADVLPVGVVDVRLAGNDVVDISGMVHIPSRQTSLKVLGQRTTDRERVVDQVVVSHNERVLHRESV